MTYLVYIIMSRYIQCPRISLKYHKLRQAHVIPKAIGGLAGRFWGLSSQVCWGKTNRLEVPTHKFRWWWSIHNLLDLEVLKWYFWEVFMSFPTTWTFTSTIFRIERAPPLPNPVRTAFSAAVAAAGYHRTSRRRSCNRFHLKPARDRRLALWYSRTTAAEKSTMGTSSILLVLSHGCKKESNVASQNRVEFATFTWSWAATLKPAAFSILSISLEDWCSVCHSWMSTSRVGFFCGNIMWQAALCLSKTGGSLKILWTDPSQKRWGAMATSRCSS